VPVPDPPEVPADDSEVVEPFADDDEPVDVDTPDVRVDEPGGVVPRGGVTPDVRGPEPVRPRVTPPVVPCGPTIQVPAVPTWAPPPGVTPLLLICSCGGWLNWPNVEVFAVVDDA